MQGLRRGRGHQILAAKQIYRRGRYDGLPPHLFDLHNDPQEFEDRGRDPGLQRQRAEMKERLFELREWEGFVAPAGTDPDIIAKWNRALVRALAMPDVRQKFAAMACWR